LGMDKQVGELIYQEEERQQKTLALIPSENYASPAVREAMASCFANKYAEGYPQKRYYQGNEVVDKLERLCQERAQKLFGVPHVNVQPLSGAPANLAIIKALWSDKNDVQLSQLLSSGGHLSMGQEVSVTNMVMPAVFYTLDKSGEINWEELFAKAREHKPRIIWSGGTGYTRIFHWEKYRLIADEVGAYFVADISHIGGLVAGGAHPTPVPYADVVMTTTHKSLRGPRGAMIMVTDRGLKKDPDLGQKIDKAVFPGTQGGPHMENVAALVVALAEAGTEEFKEYSRQIVANANTLASELAIRGYELVGGGTENHMVWIDLSNKGIDGWTAAWALEYAGMIANRQTVPDDAKSAYYPSGLRLGTPAVTTRGMKEAEMKTIAGWIDKAVESCRVAVGSKYKDIGNPDKVKDQEARKKFKDEMASDAVLAGIKKEVEELCGRFLCPR